MEETNRSQPLTNGEKLKENLREFVISCWKGEKEREEAWEKLTTFLDKEVERIKKRSEKVEQIYSKS